MPVESAATATPGQWPTLNEDWLAACLGGLSIALVLGGLRPAIPVFVWTSGVELTHTVFGVQNLANALTAGAVLLALASVGLLLTKESIAQFAMGFPALYALACAALIIAGNTTVTAWGFEYVIFAFVLGLVISNVVGVPSWLQGAVRTEYYIKIGMVILGASIVFGDLLQAGLLGIAQAVLVVTAVWFVCFWLARRLGVDDEFAAMLASAVSICGVSAAIAACGAIQGDRKKLSYVTSLVLIVAAPMMVIMPHVVRTFGIPDAVGGAWLGGTLDTSASVVAAGEMLSDAARDVGVVVKLSQNVLIGVAALLLTMWWTIKHRGNGTEQASGVRVIWDRFPKFVLGFIAASFVMSFLIEETLIAETKALLTGVRTLWFALAFTCIGLETRFVELVSTRSRPALAFLGGQAFNVVWTLLLAYVLFGGWFVDVPVFDGAQR